MWPPTFYSAATMRSIFLPMFMCGGYSLVHPVPPLFPVVQLIGILYAVPLYYQGRWSDLGNNTSSTIDYMITIPHHWRLLYSWCSGSPPWLLQRSGLSFTQLIPSARWNSLNPPLKSLDPGSVAHSFVSHGAFRQVTDFYNCFLLNSSC